MLFFIDNVRDSCTENKNHECNYNMKEDYNHYIITQP